MVELKAIVTEEIIRVVLTTRNSLYLKEYELIDQIMKNEFEGKTGEEIFPSLDKNLETFISFNKRWGLQHSPPPYPFFPLKEAMNKWGKSPRCFIVDEEIMNEWRPYQEGDWLISIPPNYNKRDLKVFFNQILKRYSEKNVQRKERIREEELQDQLKIYDEKVKTNKSIREIAAKKYGTKQHYHEAAMSKAYYAVKKKIDRIKPLQN